MNLKKFSFIFLIICFHIHNILAQEFLDNKDNNMNNSLTQNKFTLLHIASFLSQNEIKKFSLISKHCSSIMEENEIWEIYAKKYALKFSVPFPKEVENYKKYLKEISTFSINVLQETGKFITISMNGDYGEPLIETSKKINIITSPNGIYRLKIGQGKGTGFRCRQLVRVLQDEIDIPLIPKEQEKYHLFINSINNYGIANGSIGMGKRKTSNDEESREHWACTVDIERNKLDLFDDPQESEVLGTSNNNNIKLVVLGKKRLSSSKYCFFFEEKKVFIDFLEYINTRNSSSIISPRSVEKILMNSSGTHYVIWAVNQYNNLVYKVCLGLKNLF